ncbi:MAG: crossover junction endodeoxyribonuclease RuvC [Spirochaetia bacterium]
MKTIIGIDPGLKNTGFGIIRISNNSAEHIDHGVISTPPEAAKGSRLECIHKTITGLVEKYKPEEAGIEEIFFAKNLKSAIPVAQAIGVILCALSLMNVTTFSYTPLEVKRGVVGRGRAEKEQVQELVRIILGLREVPQPDHAADALAVALCHAHSLTLRNLMKTGEGRGV